MPKYYHYYKNQYFLACYDAEDYCVGTFDNCKSLAKFLGKTLNSTQSSVQKVLDGILTFMINDKGNFFKVYAYPIYENQFDNISN